MRVGRAFSSHRELWQDLPKRVREKKSATDNVLGELYEPRIKHDGSFDRAKDCDPKQYFEPCEGQGHKFVEKGKPAWHKDINYPGSRRPSALLVGEAGRSFLWSKPSIYLPGILYQGYKKFTSAQGFAKELQPVK